jgi:nicotinamide-nucleotide amidase
MPSINASIITIGDELLIGQTIDTNSAFIAKKLNEIGIWLRRRLAVGDLKNEIIAALEEESRNAGIVIITGGLGPTADDITKPVLCEYFGSTLVRHKETETFINEIFTRLGRPVGERNLKQADLPDNCQVLFNKRGTAPGMWFEKNGVICISLPGVPHEMKGIMEDEVLPRLKKLQGLPVILHRTLLTAGAGESVIADKLESFESILPSHIKLAYLPSYGQVKLRLTSQGSSAQALEPELDDLFDKLKTEVAEWLVIDDDLPMEKVIMEVLSAKGATLATAESCTGGYISHLITSMPGSSKIFKGSVVAYANDVKSSVLQVDKNTLDKYGAVSEQTVKEMLQGVIQNLSADYGIATSGIMGPDGGSPEKPVGTVWVAVGNIESMEAKKFHYRFDRQRNIELTALGALDFLRRFILKKDQDSH